MTFLRRVLSLIVLLCLAAGPVAAQRINRGVVHRRSSQTVVTNDYSIPFPPTPVNTTSIQDCYYDCFYQSGSPPESCDYSGTIVLVQSVNLPFRVTNYRKGIVNGGCGGTPVSLPVSLQPGEWLLQDFEFSPTSPGTFSDALTYDLTPTATATSRFSWLLSGSTGSTTPIIDSFAATPPTIRAGQQVTLSWVTEGASSVVIDHGVGTQPVSGSVSVSPSTTTTYTLTAMNGSDSVTSSVTVNVLTAPIVVVSAFPSGLLQAQGVGGATTTYTLTNAGGTATNITLGQSGTFFTQTPTSITLAPGGSQLITISGLAQSANSFQGFSNPSGNGVPSSLQIPIKLLSAAPPAGTVTAAPATNRVDVNQPGGGSVNFTNDGDATLTGILVSDVPWLIPQAGVVSIPPHSTVTVTFTIDRSQRSDSAAPVGSASGNLSLVYLSGPAAKIASNDVAPVSVSFVTVVDTVQLSVSTTAPPALGPGEVALFVPGVGHVLGSVGLFISDVSVLNPLGSAINDLRFYYTPRGQGTGSSKSAAVNSVPSSVSVALADVVKNVFGADADVGSLQIRSSVADKLGVSTNIFVSSNPKGTFGTSIPTFRSDRAIGAGEKLFLTGLAQQPTLSHTNLFIQETAGVGVSVHSEFLSADGSTLSTRDDLNVGPFTLLQIGSPAPSGAVSAIMTNTSTGTGRFLAYATPVDEKSSDTWSVVDWSRQFGYSQAEVVIVPVAGRTQGISGFFRTDAAIMNTGSTFASGTLRYVSGSTVLDRQITLGARQTSAIADLTGTLFGITTPTVGYLVFTPVNGTFAITSRTYATLPNEPGTFGSATPTLALAAALKNGSLRAIGSLEDALPGSVKRPATFRTNFGLSEVTGNSVTVRVTLRFTYPAGAKVQGIGTAFKDYNLSPNQYLQVNGMAADILGANRATVGDLRGFEADFQVIGGDGAVTVFTSSVDNGTADSILRTE
jgi:hypothetical protein